MADGDPGTDAHLEGLAIDMLDDAGSEDTTTEETTTETAAAEGETSEKPDPNEEIAALRQELQQVQANTQNLVGEVLRSVAGGQKETPREDPQSGVKKQLQDVNNGIAWAIKNNPEAVPKLMEKRDELRDGVLVDRATDRAMRKMGAKNASGLLRNRLYQGYQDAINDKSSRIASDAVANKDAILDVLSEFMDDAQLDRFKDSADSDTLAYLLSAGLNPEEVSKREVDRSKVKEEARQKALGRLAGLTGAGGAGRTTREPEIGDEDQELAETFGFDLSDEETREKLLKAKRSENLRGIGGAIRLER